MFFTSAEAAAMEVRLERRYQPMPPRVVVFPPFSVANGYEPHVSVQPSRFL